MATGGPTLKDFIVEAMWSIHSAVDELQRKAAQDTPKVEKDGTVLWNHRPAFAPEVEVEGAAASGLFHTKGGQVVTIVQFDVAVVANSEVGAKGGFGIFVAGIGVGAQASGKDSSQSSTRIQFNIPVMFPNPSNYVWEEQEKAKAKKPAEAVIAAKK